MTLKKVAGEVIAALKYLSAVKAMRGPTKASFEICQVVQNSALLEAIHNVSRQVQRGGGLRRVKIGTTAMNDVLAHCMNNGQPSLAVSAPVPRQTVSRSIPR